MTASGRALSRLFLALVSGLGLTAVLLLGLMLTEAGLSVTARSPSNQALAGSPTGIVTAVGRHLERNGVPFEVRGMNYYPKDFAWDRFWISYTTAITQIDTELDLAKALGVNTVRIFLPYALFDGSDQADLYLGYLTDFVNRLQARDMVAIVTLFDFYAGVSPGPYSVTDYPNSEGHISTVVNTLGTANPTVLAWDFKNELDRDYADFGEAEVTAWATEMISYTRRLDPNHLITIGFYGAVTGTPCYDPAVTDALAYNPAIAAEFAPLVDFVSMHYFLSERCFESDVQALQSLIGDKPLVLEEFGLHTLATPSIPCADNLDDPRCDVPHTETEQAAYYNALLSLSEAYGLAGYLFWTLNDFSHILPDSRKSEHCLGILRNSNVTVCEVTSPTDYTEKPAADTVRRHYADSVVYLDLFDVWVVPDTDEAPPGWTDNWVEGGALLRGYNPSQLLWSHNPGKVAFSKFVTNSTSITGLAISPMLTNVNVDRYPFLSGQVSSYSVRDATYGSDSMLHVGVKEEAQMIRLLTIAPGASLPYTFTLDLRQPPTGWSGSRNFQIVFELVPEGTGDGYSATYEFDWVAIQGCSQIYHDTAWTLSTCPTDPSVSDTMMVWLDGVEQPEPAARLELYHVNDEGTRWPAVAVLYASGFVRLKQNADPTPPIPFGTSAVLGPAYWADGVYHHNPTLESVHIATDWLPNGPLRLVITGTNGDFAVRYEVTMPPPSGKLTRWHVTQTYTATSAISPDADRLADHEGFKLAQFSTMFINQAGSCNGGDSGCHDADGVRYIATDGARRQVAFADVGSGWVFSPTSALGNVWFDVLHSDDQSWQGNTPNLRLALDKLPDDWTITPQGWISPTSDPAQDNVGLWLHDDGAADWSTGQSASVGYWLLAQDDPPDPWADHGLVAGETVLDFEDNYNCWALHGGGAITATLRPIASYWDTALELVYDLGGQQGAWAQLRCDFDPPLDLSAADHLSFFYRGLAGAANSLEIGVITWDGTQEHFFSRGIHHITHVPWWTYRALPFAHLGSWAQGDVFDPSQVRSIFFSVVKDGDDVGGNGALAVDRLETLALRARTVPPDFEAGFSHPLAAAQAADWIAGRQVPTGLVKSWTEEGVLYGWTYDQALALLALKDTHTTAAADLAKCLAALQNSDGSWYDGYYIDSLDPITTNKWVGSIAWLDYALARYTTRDWQPATALAACRASAWLAARQADDGCLLEHVEGNLDAWWALQATGHVAEADRLRDCILDRYWDEEMGRLKGGTNSYATYLDNQTWGAAFLKAIGEEAKARRALSYARAVLLTPSSGGQVVGFDGSGPYSVWNEGTAQYVVAGGEGAADFLDELLAQQGWDGGQISAQDDFAGDIVWLSRWHGIAPTAWLRFALTDEPFQPGVMVPCPLVYRVWLPVVVRNK